jgi:predicted O-methyltransferase YrrM
VNTDILKRFALISFQDPKAALAAVIFKSAMNIDKKFRKTWKLVNKTRGYLSKSEAYVLYFLAQKCSSLGAIVEIGSYEGRSTIALAGGHQV